jgi:hypothetical protein
MCRVIQMEATPVSPNGSHVRLLRTPGSTNGNVIFQINLFEILHFRW